jgi:hypothetical protein
MPQYHALTALQRDARIAKFSESVGSILQRLLTEPDFEPNQRYSRIALWTSDDARVRYWRSTMFVTVGDGRGKQPAANAMAINQRMSGWNRGRSSPSVMSANCSPPR